MNERIKELERQATETVKCGLNGTSTAESFNRKKFAELIVAECVGVSDDYVRGCLCEEHKNIKRPRSTIGRKIREHFGVEE
jgi:hypothetical protein